MATPEFVGEGLGGTTEAAPWVTVDLSTWTLTAGDVANLVLSTTAGQIVIDDLAANTDPADWSYYTGPAIQANKRYELLFERTNPAVLDAVGVTVGIRDTADNSPRFTGGVYRSSVAKAHFGVTETTYWTATVDVDKVLVSFITDKDGKASGFTSVALTAAGAVVAAQSYNTSPTVTSGVLCAYVRHGAVLGTGPSTLQYSFKYRIVDEDL